MATKKTPLDEFSTFDVTRVRRIVTGHDDAGQAIVTIEGVCRYHGLDPKHPGVSATTLWREGAEIDFSDNEDQVRKYRRIPTGGTQFFLSQIDPGTYVEPHRTKTVDHHFVISGEITCIFDQGEFTARAGDVIVQRGTDHAWENRGSVPFVSAVFMRSAHDQE